MTSKKKHVPQRTCIACRKVIAKRDLIRIVRTPLQTIVVDETGKAQGRGAYICKQSECWQKALNQGIIAHSLKTAISSEDMALLKQFAAILA